MTFFQDPPRPGHPYEGDRVLRNFLRRAIPEDHLPVIEADLRAFGDRIETEVEALGLAAEAQPPRHVPFDPWGRRVDRIEVSEAWRRLDAISAEEGLVALAHARRHGASSRLHQFAKVYLFHPASAYYTCPLAMTDGAARALDLHGDELLKGRFLPHLTSFDPATFWTSGQWMTERTGGSDVSGTSTVARFEEGSWRLFGDKWFTSATTSQMAMTLARTEGQADLSLFCLELRDGDGALRNLRVNRLKDKLGTKALPTAELSLEGTPAFLVGGEGHGVRKIASLFNLTRIWNAVCATAFLRRGLALARDYARRRQAFGRSLADQPLHLETLADLAVDHAACFHLTFHLAGLLGREECGEATENERALLRLLTPVAKLWTARKSVAAMSEVLESFGGAGYVEDTGLPRLLRDAQVLAIWEGTTNVLSLDLLRALQKEAPFEVLAQDLRQRMQGLQRPDLRQDAARLEAGLREVEASLSGALAGGAEALQSGARRLAFALAQLTSSVLLLEQAEADGDPLSAAQARRACGRPLPDLAPADLHEARRLALDEP